MVSSTRIVVLVPQHLPANVTISLSNNAQDFAFSNVDFEFTPSFSIHSVFPTSGPLEGGQLVTLRGMGFPQGVACVFNGTRSPVEILSSTLLLCASPAREAGFSSLALLGAGADLDEAELQRYVPSISGEVLLISGVTPAVSIKVLVPDLITPNPVCIHGTKKLMADMVTSSLLKCAAVAVNVPSSIALSVSGDGVSFTKQFFVFQYVPGISIIQVMPQMGVMGVISDIRVVGAGFRGQNWLCRFGSVSYPAVLQTSSSLLVRVQPLTVGTVSIVISHDELHTMGSAFSYMAHDPIVLESVQPSHGHDVGNTVVLVQGSNFIRSSTLKCQFGSTSVEAIWFSPSTVECISPPGKPGNTSLRVTNNGLQFSSSFLTYEFRQRASVISALPSQGPVQGGALITLNGIAFLGRTASGCVFGQAVTKASILSSTRAICASPPASPGSVPLSMTTNSLDLARSSVSFVFLEIPQDLTVNPSVGSALGGAVTITGENFGACKKFHCRFGATSNLIAAGFVTSTAITCKTPAQRPGYATIRVLCDLIELVSTGLQFHYFPAPQLAEILPTSGSIEGSERITVFGANFVNSPSFVCKFGLDIVVPAEWKDSDRNSVV